MPDLEVRSHPELGSSHRLRGFAPVCSAGVRPLLLNKPTSDDSGEGSEERRRAALPPASLSASPGADGKRDGSIALPGPDLTEPHLAVNQVIVLKSVGSRCVGGELRPFPSHILASLA